MTKSETQFRASNLTESEQADIQRLKRLFDEKAGLSQKAFGSRWGIGSPAMMSQYLTGKRSLGLAAAIKFAKGLSVEVADISPTLARQLPPATPTPATGDAVMPASIELVGPPEGYIRLEHLSAQPSMGNGAVVDELEQVVQHLDVLERWVREEVGSVDAQRIKVLTAKGRSMWPAINHRDLVFVDVAQRAIDAPGIYVVDVAGRLLLKKALILANGTLILRSENQTEFPDEERYDLAKEGDTITICGKVLAWWSLRKG